MTSPKKLRDPERMFVGIAGWPVQVRRIVGIGEVELAVGVELPILDQQLDLLGTGGKSDRVVGAPRVTLVADEIEPGQTGHEVQPDDAQGVVVEPERGSLPASSRSCTC